VSFFVDTDHFEQICDLAFVSYEAMVDRVTYLMRSDRDERLRYGLILREAITELWPLPPIPDKERMRQ
jgi:hypothetical protein